MADGGGGAGSTNWLVAIQTMLARIGSMEPGSASRDAAALAEAINNANAAAAHLSVFGQDGLEGVAASSSASAAQNLFGEITSGAAAVTPGVSALTSASAVMAASKAQEPMLQAMQMDMANPRVDPATVLDRAASMMTATYNAPMSSAAGQAPSGPDSLELTKSFGSAGGAVGTPSGSGTGGGPGSVLHSTSGGSSDLGDYANGAAGDRATGAAGEGPGPGPSSGTTPEASGAAGGSGDPGASGGSAGGGADGLSRAGLGSPDGAAGSPGSGGAAEGTSTGGPLGAPVPAPATGRGLGGSLGGGAFGGAGAGGSAGGATGGPSGRLSGALPASMSPTATAPGATTGPAGTGRTGPGSTGAAPHGARGRGEDKEHKSAHYLHSRDNGAEIVGDLPLVGPPVIGDWTPPTPKRDAGESKSDDPDTKLRLD